MSLRTPQHTHARTRTHTHARTRTHAHTHTHTHTHTQDLIQNFKLPGNSNLAVAKVQIKNNTSVFVDLDKTRSSKNFPFTEWLKHFLFGPATHQIPS